MNKMWRPISLINVDAKIASKTLAKLLGNVFTEIIHSNQNVFGKGRSISDAITQQLMICGAYQREGTTWNFSGY